MGYISSDMVVIVILGIGRYGIRYLEGGSRIWGREVIWLGRGRVRWDLKG